MAMYSESELSDILSELRVMPGETEVVEFKKAKNGFDDENLGRYFSALSNEANLKSQICAWMVFGIDDITHEVVGSNYKQTRTSLDAMKKAIADQTTSRITFEEIYTFQYESRRVVMFQIPAAPQGIPVAYQGHYYGRDGESLVALNIQEIEKIRSQNRKCDWSREIVPDATIEDLDSNAIAKAREKYVEKHPDKAEEVLSWSDCQFLNKAKLTLKDKITNAALVLLGKEESGALIRPSTPSIKWILKDRDGLERDYEIFYCPLIINIEKAAAKVRNLKYRYINPELQTIFPDEVDTYDSYVIREALNNAVAHMDYTLSGQVTLVEFEDKIVFSNKGAFIPGDIENVLKGDAPEITYRNEFLANAMVNLKMVDTIGSGIKKMYSKQRDRLFPMPVFEFTPDKVTLTITGKIIDINYSNILAKNKQLSLYDIELLNRIQFGQKPTAVVVTYLKKKGLIEGRMPNVYISKKLATVIDKKVDYSKHKGLDERKCRSLIEDALKDHSQLSKSEIVELLWNILPDILDDKQKITKVENLLKKMKKDGMIDCTGKGRFPKWLLVK